MCNPCAKTPISYRRVMLSANVATRGLQKVTAGLVELAIAIRCESFVLILQDSFSECVNLEAVPGQPSKTVASAKAYIFIYLIARSVFQSMEGLSQRT